MSTDGFAPGSAWVVRPRSNPGARLRLFCFPYAGGGPSVFRTWPAELPNWVEVCAIALPGREMRFNEPPLTRLADLVAALASALQPWLERPFAFFGHSMGALVGFEMARLLRRRMGIEPVHLFVSAYRAPHLSAKEPPRFALPREAFLEELRRLDGTPAEVLQHPELVDLLLPMLRADFEVCETYTYRPGPRFKCPISVLGGMQDSRVSHEDMQAWSCHTSGAFHLQRFPGGHFFLQTAITPVLSYLSRQLESHCVPER